MAKEWDGYEGGFTQYKAEADDEYACDGCDEDLEPGDLFWKDSFGEIYCDGCFVTFGDE